MKRTYILTSLLFSTIVIFTTALTVSDKTLKQTIIAAYNDRVRIFSEALDSDDDGMVRHLLRQYPGLINAEDEFSYHPIYLAAKNGNKEMVQLLLSYGASVNSGDGSEAPLNKAITLNDIGMAELLIKNGANVNVKDIHGRTPLYTAVLYQKEKMADLLIQHGADIDAGDSEGWTPLLVAVANCCDNISQFLISKGADVNKALYKDGSTALIMNSSYTKSATIADMLLKNGASVNTADCRGMTSLHIAAREKSFEVVEVLISHGANINVKDLAGKTPLDYALDNTNILSYSMNRKPIVDLLVLHGASVPGFHAAIATGNLMKVKMYLQNKPALLSSEDKELSSPICCAAAFDRIDAAKYLISLGADVKRKDRHGVTPLECGIAYTDMTGLLISKGAAKDESGKGFTSAFYHAVPDRREVQGAVPLQHREVIRFLISKGVKPDLAALLKASEGRDEEIVKLLISSGIDVNGKNSGGWTPLHYAAERGRNKIVEALLKADADVNARDLNGFTPLHYAAFSGSRAWNRITDCSFDHKLNEQESKAQHFPETVTLLLRHGAAVNARNKIGKTPLSYSDKHDVYSIIRSFGGVE